MRILKLYSNLEGFETIYYNQQGFTFIYGEKGDTSSTYNGTGKTLMISLIDFCLGSNAKKELKVLNCDFFLDYLDSGAVHTVRRNTVEQKNIFVDGEKKSLKQFREDLADIIGLKIKPNITSRTKFRLVCRYEKSSFIDPLDCGDGASAFQHLLNYFDEFGFGLDLLYEKNKNNNDLAVSKKVVKQLKGKDIKEVLTDSDKDIKIEKIKLANKIEEKEKQLTNLKVADNIEELKKELANDSSLYNDALNHIVILNKRYDKILKSFSNNIYSDEKKVLKMYDDYKRIFGSDIVRNIDDVIKFHNDLLEKRTLRQNEQLLTIKNELKTFETKKEQYKKRINEIYSSLDNKIDLSELNSIMSEITQLKIRYEKINSYCETIKQQEDKQMYILKDFTEQNIIAGTYLDEIDKQIQRISNCFNEYAYIMYGNDINSYIILKNNLNINSIRYDFEVKIPNDGSDGITNAKIMCFDLMLKKLGKSKYEFLIHDNKIFYGLDYSMVAKLLKKLYEDKISFQYILTINESDYNELKKEINDDDLFYEMVEKNIKVKLTGKNKLLGRTIELKRSD